MTDTQIANYECRIEPVREAFHDRQAMLEARAEAGIARDLDGLGGVHGDVIAFIEGRWTRWLDAALLQLTERYRLDADRIRREVEST